MQRLHERLPNSGGLGRPSRQPVASPSSATGGYNPSGRGGGTMTQRKPPGTSWESWIDSQIRVAQEQGAFDNLPGAGKPLPNIDQDYDPMWWVKGLADREQLSLLPPSLELLRKVEKELAAIDKLPDEAT